MSIFLGGQNGGSMHRPQIDSELMLSGAPNRDIQGLVPATVRASKFSTGAASDHLKKKPIVTSREIREMAPQCLNRAVEF